MIRIAQLQMPVYTEKTQALQYIEEHARLAAGADFLLLPEMFACPYKTSSFPLYAEKEQGPLWQACAQLAQKYHIYLSAGTMPERDEHGHIYNTAYVFDRDGRQIAKHRKMHLFDIDITGQQHFRESDTLTAGNTVTTFATEFGTFGLCICYDFRFPELGRLMALHGALVILVPAAFNLTTGPAHWELMFRSQAVNNQVFAIGTSPARDTEASYIAWGHSILTDPWGNIVHQMNEQAGLALTEIDLHQIASIRAQLPLLKHRRTDIYTLSENHPETAKE